MQEDAFRIYLESPLFKLSINGVNTRLSRARKAEGLLGLDLDTVVSDDELMYDSLQKLQSHEDPKHNPMQNAVRKYYAFRNGKEFPQLRYFRK